VNQQNKKNKKEAKALPGGSAEVFSGRAMPESLSAEAAVLGSMLIDPECIGSVIEAVGASAFYRHEHQLIFEALVSLFESNASAIDAVLLRDELSKRKQLDAAGGVEYIARILDSVPSSANVEYYTKIIKDKMLLREIIEAAGEILTDAYNEGGETAEKLDKAEQKIFAVTNKKMSGSASPLNSLIVQAYDSIEKRDGSHVTGLETGFRQLDELTCGLQKGEMLIVAGRPSMGKTSFALNIAETVGIKNKMPVAIFSLEMGKEQLAERLLCSLSHTDSQKVRKGDLTVSEFQQLAATCEEMKDCKIYIDDTAGLSPLELRAKARRLKSQYDIQCIFIDYLQLMNAGADRSESRQQEITLISRYLKGIARELSVPVIVISQLNRAAENRENHRPRMSDLRES
jgi:replicative DNA helicase